MSTLEVTKHTDIVEAEQTKVDALIVLGRNIIPGYNRRRLAAEESHLSPLSTINALAAGLMYSQGRADVLILSSGYTMGQDLPSEAKAMKTLILKTFTDIPPDRILLEETSFDTPSNAAEVGTLVGKKDFKTLGLLTDGEHLQRATGLFERQGMQVQPFNSLQVLEGSQFTETLNAYTGSRLHRRIKLREKIISLLPEKSLQRVARRMRAATR